MMVKQSLLTAMVSVLAFGCGSDPHDQVEAESPTPEPAALEIPYDSLTLNDLSAFVTTGKNWEIAGGVSSDYRIKHDLVKTEGAGILVNLPVESGAEHISSIFEHMDIEISFDVMVPKESNSGVYFQGRYEVQILDSWGIKNPGHGDMGGLYQRWEEDHQGFEGRAPNINAAIAPGLWQHFHILFRAPRFDTNGQKVKNALFEYVYLNDRLIHENVEVKGPTRSNQLEGEAPEGPLFIQGDHGPVAFKNFRYKLSGIDTISLSAIQYDFYDVSYDHLPSFDSITPTSSGSAAYIDIGVASKKEEYGLVFRGKMLVPNEGLYLFETDIDDGGDFWIDSVLVVSNSSKMGRDQYSSLIRLDSGTHDFMLSYVQDLHGALALISYEGPEISKRVLGAPPVLTKTKSDHEKQLILAPPTAPEMIRGFIMHRGQKLTHTISVGDPSGVHFAYDLRTAALVKVWKGEFGNATEMWEGRGKEQILQPILASVDLSNGSPFAQLQSPDERWPEENSGIEYMGYHLKKSGRPVFRYKLNGNEILDEISPVDSQSIMRVVTTQGEHPIWLKLGEGKVIHKVAEHLYSVDGDYYIISSTELIVRQGNHAQELLAIIQSNDFSYQILW